MKIFGVALINLKTREISFHNRGLGGKASVIQICFTIIQTGGKASGLHHELEVSSWME